ncbi:MAG: hydroxymethylglutaryl-CoA lyase [Bdellovibrionota bacterium]|nr:MAG: hydroxymethylglutaryl-CoA lyase [Bdellovibrionota bacterium]
MLPKTVTIRELGPREGFQLLPHTVSTADKLRLIELLVRTGVPEIEVVSFVRPDRVPQMADAEEIVTQLPDLGSSTIFTGLYLNPKGFQRSLQSKRLLTRGWIASAVSESFLRSNANITFQEEESRIREWVALFQTSGVGLHGLLLSTAFGCAIEGPISVAQALGRLSRLLDQVQAAGDLPSEICLADTVGLGDPEQVRSLIQGVRTLSPAARITLHLHDTRGTGMANVYAGLLEGVDCFECSVGGVGGCPFTPGAAGNVPTEDVAYLCERLGIATGVDLRAYSEAARFVETLAQHPLPGRFYKSR